MTGIQLSEEQVQTAMKDKNHLRKWLEASGRRWLVFNGVDLIDALPWPDGANALVQIIQCYRDHRLTLPTGDTEIVKDDLGQEHKVDVMKNETLTIEEIDRAIRYLITQATERDSQWAINNPPL